MNARELFAPDEMATGRDQDGRAHRQKNQRVRQTRTAKDEDREADGGGAGDESQGGVAAGIAEQQATRCPTDTGGEQRPEQDGQWLQEPILTGA